MNGKSVKEFLDYTMSEVTRITQLVLNHKYCCPLHSTVYKVRLDTVIMSMGKSAILEDAKKVEADLFDLWEIEYLLPTVLATKESEAQQQEFKNNPGAFVPKGVLPDGLIDFIRSIATGKAVPQGGQYQLGDSTVSVIPINLSGHDAPAEEMTDETINVKGVGKA